MRILFLWMLISFLFSINIIKAQNNSKDKTKKQWWKKIESDNIMELRSAFEFESSSIQKLEYLFVPQISIPISRKLKFVGIGRFYLEAMDKLEPDRPMQSSISSFSKRLLLGDRVELELREFYLDWKIKKHYITFGKQQIVWGKADGLKILDIVNPMNFREFLLDDFDNSRIPLWSIKADLKVKKLNIQPVWIFDQSYNDFPNSEAVFFPEAFFGELPLGVEVTDLGVKKPKHLLKDSDLGLKISSFMKGWEFTLNYLYHYDDFPIVNSNLENESGSPTLILETIYKRHHLAGGTFNNTFGPFTFRGELGLAFGKYFNSTNLDYKNGTTKSNQFIGVLGLDYSGFTNTQIGIQIFEDVLFENIEPTGRNQSETFASFLYSRNFMNDILTANIIIVQNFSHGDGFIKPAVKYLLRDNLYGTLGADIFFGDRNASFGQFRNRSRISIAFELGL